METPKFGDYRTLKGSGERGREQGKGPVSRDGPKKGGQSEASLLSKLSGIFGKTGGTGGSDRCVDRDVSTNHGSRSVSGTDVGHGELGRKGSVAEMIDARTGRPKFTFLPDLASSAFGGRVIFATDEFHGRAGSMLEDQPLPGESDTATADTASASAGGIKAGDIRAGGSGWETRRRREEGHDWALIQLGRPAVIHGIEIDCTSMADAVPAFVSVEVTSATSLEQDLIHFGSSRHPSLCGACTPVRPRVPSVGDSCLASATQLQVRQTFQADALPAELIRGFDQTLDASSWEEVLGLTSLREGPNYFAVVQETLPGEPVQLAGASATGADGGMEMGRIEEEGKDRKRGKVGKEAGKEGGKEGTGGSKYCDKELVLNTLTTSSTLDNVGSDEPSVVTFLRVNLLPDGGIRRLRVFGEIRPNVNLLRLEEGEEKSGCLNYASPLLGAWPVFCTNGLASVPQILQDGKRGWRTPRQLLRPPIFCPKAFSQLQEVCVVRLAARCVPQVIEVDCSNVRGCAPSAIQIEAFDAGVDPNPGAIPDDSSETDNLPLPLAGQGLILELACATSYSDFGDWKPLVLESEINEDQIAKFVFTPTAKIADGRDFAKPSRKPSSAIGLGTAISASNAISSQGQRQTRQTRGMRQIAPQNAYSESQIVNGTANGGEESGMLGGSGGGKALEDQTPIAREKKTIETDEACRLSDDLEAITHLKISIFPDGEITQIRVLANATKPQRPPLGSDSSLTGRGLGVQRRRNSLLLLNSFNQAFAPNA